MKALSIEELYQPYEGEEWVTYNNRAPGKVSSIVNKLRV